jgi:hypothetical protein
LFSRAARIILSADLVARVDATVNERTVHDHRYSETMRAPIDTEEVAAA